MLRTSDQSDALTALHKRSTGVMSVEVDGRLRDDHLLEDGAHAWFEFVS